MGAHRCCAHVGQSGVIALKRESLIAVYLVDLGHHCKMGEEAAAYTLSPPWGQSFLTQNSCLVHCLCCRGLDRRPPAAAGPMVGRELEVVRMATDAAVEPGDSRGAASSAAAQAIELAANDEENPGEYGEQRWCAVGVAGVEGAAGAVDAVDVVGVAGGGQAVASPGPGGGDACRAKRAWAGG